MTRAGRVALACLVLLVGGTQMIGAQGVTPATSQPVELSEADRLAWDRVRLMEQLAEAREALQKAQDTAILQHERAELEARLQAHYHLGLGDLTRGADGRFMRKVAPPGPGVPP